MRLGFSVAMLTAIARLCRRPCSSRSTAREAIHIILTLGIGAALIRFGMLERRAHRDG